MSELAQIVITAIGAITPVGANTKQSYAAMKAEMNRISEHAYFTCAPDDPEWDEELPLYVSDVPVIDLSVDGIERLYTLALPALSEVMNRANLTRADLEKSGLMIALPQVDKVISALNLPSVFIPELCNRTGLSNFKLFKTSQAGHTGVFSLLPSAVQKLQAGDLQYCIVGGVDSYLLEERLGLLDAAWRLRSERSVDGFIPGESSAMFLLETAASARDRGMPILATLGVLGEGTETETIHSNKHSTGEGLAEAIEKVSLTNAETAVSFENVYCSLNGESYYAFEWGVVLARQYASLQDMKKLVHPADCVGDIGAASGALLIAYAALDYSKEKVQTSPSLLWTSSDSGHRMALQLHKG